MKKAIVMSSIVLCAAAGSFAEDRITTDGFTSDVDRPVRPYQEQVAEADLSFQALDANTDGFINLEEASTQSTVADQFGALDADQDNLLSEEEFSNLTETAS